MKIKLYSLMVLPFLFVTFSQAQEVLTKERAIELALENNYGVKIANNNVEIADNNKSVLNTRYLPTVSTNAGATFNRDNITAEFSDGNSTELNGARSSRFNATINVNYTLFDGLGRFYDYKRLKEEYQLSELQARETIENTIFQLFTVYYNVAQLSKNNESLQQTLNITKDRLKRAKYQFEFGQNTKLAILNAQVDINNDSINLINQIQLYKNTKRDLNVVLGNALGNDFNVNTNVDFILGLNKETLLSKMKANNVTLLQINKNIKINNYLLKSGKSAFLPTIGLNGSYGWNRNNNNQASFLSSSTNLGLSGGVNLTWNLFDGGNAINILKNAKIDLLNQEYQKEDLIINVERDFNNAWDDYQNKLEVFRIQEDNIITSQNNFDRTQEQFKLGQTSSIEFRQAQLNLLNAELSKNQAKFDAKIAELLVLQLSGELLNVDF